MITKQIEILKPLIIYNNEKVTLFYKYYNQNRLFYTQTKIVAQLNFTNTNNSNLHFYLIKKVTTNRINIKCQKSSKKIDLGYH